MKLLVSNNEGLMNGINNALTALSGLDPEIYSVGKVLPKWDGQGYWYDIEAALNCSNKQDLKQLAQSYYNGKNLPNPVSLVEVTDLVAEGYKQGPDKQGK